MSPNTKIWNRHQEFFSGISQDANQMVDNPGNFLERVCSLIAFAVVVIIGFVISECAEMMTYQDNY